MLQLNPRAVLLAAGVLAAALAPLRAQDAGTYTAEEQFHRDTTRALARGELDRADARAGQKVSGLPATRKALQAMFPQHGDLGAALAMLGWCEDTYPDHYKGFCLFTLNRDEQWSAYDLSTWKEFHEGLRAG